MSNVSQLSINRHSCYCCCFSTKRIDSPGFWLAKGTLRCARHFVFYVWVTVELTSNLVNSEHGTEPPVLHSYDSVKRGLRLRGAISESYVAHLCPFYWRLEECRTRKMDLGSDDIVALLSSITFSHKHLLGLDTHIQRRWDPTTLDRDPNVKFVLHCCRSISRTSEMLVLESNVVLLCCHSYLFCTLCKTMSQEFMPDSGIKSLDIIEVYFTLNQWIHFLSTPQALFEPARGNITVRCRVDSGSKTYSYQDDLGEPTRPSHAWLWDNGRA